jgi:hypothetical protein
MNFSGCVCVCDMKTVFGKDLSAAEVENSVYFPAL